MIHALETANNTQKKQLHQLIQEKSSHKVEGILKIFRECGVDKWAYDLKEKYITTALHHFENIAVLSSRKEPLKQLAHFMIQREY
jgi:geranylgeranyl diphosphate synthase type II